MKKYLRKVAGVLVSAAPLALVSTASHAAIDTTALNREALQPARVALEYAQVFTHRDDFTLALGLQLYQSKAGLTPWNLLMAASSLVVAPVLLLFLLSQRTFVHGVAGEGVKE